MRPTIYFNPRSPRGGATIRFLQELDTGYISIHAPHEGERLCINLSTRNSEKRISIHAPHEGERRLVSAIAPHAACISIHAPHEGERLFNRSNTKGTENYFNPRSPRGGATIPTIDVALVTVISIHAPHEGERRASISS